MPLRLQKYLADAGVASRRASESIILGGRVKVNGQIVRELGTKVAPGDTVEVDNTPVKIKRKIYLALHKPPGFICSRHDPLKRPSVYELLPKEWANLFTVGRLDFKSEGLIFLTNDGQFSLQLTHPRFGVRKKYLATVEGHLQPTVLEQITNGIFHQGERLKAEQARLLKSSKSQSTVELVLREGRNREVRRLFEAQGFSLKRLQRTQIGSVKLGELPKGRWRTLTTAEIKSLLNVSQRPCVES